MASEFSEPQHRSSEEQWSAEAWAAWVIEQELASGIEQAASEEQYSAEEWAAWLKQQELASGMEEATSEQSLADERRSRVEKAEANALMRRHFVESKILESTTGKVVCF